MNNPAIHIVLVTYRIRFLLKLAPFAPKIDQTGENIISSSSRRSLGHLDIQEIQHFYFVASDNIYTVTNPDVNPYDTAG